MSQSALPTTPITSPTIPTSSGRMPALSRRTTHTASLWQLVRNELFILRRRRLIWLLLGGNLLFVLGAWIVLLFYVSRNSDVFLSGHLLAGPDALANAIAQPMTLGRRAGEFVAIALGGLAFGGEFSSGAIRLALSRGVKRGTYLFAKYIALAMLCLALVIASLVVSMLFVNMLILIHNPAPTLLDLDGHTLISLLLLLPGSYGNYLFCLLFGAALSSFWYNYRFSLPDRRRYRRTTPASAGPLNANSERQSDCEPALYA